MLDGTLGNWQICQSVKDPNMTFREFMAQVRKPSGELKLSPTSISKYEASLVTVHNRCREHHIIGSSESLDTMPADQYNTCIKLYFENYPKPDGNYMYSACLTLHRQWRNAR